MTNVKGKPKSRLLSTPFHKYDHVCGEGFSAQTRRERRAYPSGVCKARATTSGPKRTAARRVASLFGSGVVAPRSSRQVGTGDAPSSRLARTEKRRNKRGRIYGMEYLGENGVSNAPSDPELNKLAVRLGHTLVHGDFASGPNRVLVHGIPAR